jgi:peptide/nickel transport system permease protein
MLAFIIRRLLQSVIVLLAMSVIVFAGVTAIGDPVEVMSSPDSTQAEREATRLAMGLDKPLPVQYWRFLTGALSGDLGKSFAYGAPAVDLILERMPATFELAIAAMLIAVVLLGFSLPTFWVGLMMIMLFSVQLGWLPTSGRGETVTLLGLKVSFLTRDGLVHLLMPALNLALFKLSLIIRLTRAGTQEALLQDYVKFARAKGLAPARVVGVHVLKNIMIPIVTVIGLEFGGVIAFAIVTETIFAWPGMGKLIIDSIAVLDRPIIVAYLLVIVILFVFINLVVDVLYSVLDPRVRLANE